MSGIAIQKETVRVGCDGDVVPTIACSKRKMLIETLPRIQQLRRLSTAIGIPKRDNARSVAAIDNLEYHFQRQDVIAGIDVEIALRCLRGFGDGASKNALEPVGSEHRQ